MIRYQGVFCSLIQRETLEQVTNINRRSARRYWRQSVFVDMAEDSCGNFKFDPIARDVLTNAVDICYHYCELHVAAAMCAGTGVDGLACGPPTVTCAERASDYRNSERRRHVYFDYLVTQNDRPPPAHAAPAS
jgi:hypothetical protein